MAFRIDGMVDRIVQGDVKHSGPALRLLLGEVPYPILPVTNPKVRSTKGTPSPSAVSQQSSVSIDTAAAPTPVRAKQPCPTSSKSIVVLATDNLPPPTHRSAALGSGPNNTKKQSLAKPVEPKRMEPSGVPCWDFGTSGWRDASTVTARETREDKEDTIVRE